LSYAQIARQNVNPPYHHLHPSKLKDKHDNDKVYVSTQNDQTSDATSYTKSIENIHVKHTTTTSTVVRVSTRINKSTINNQTSCTNRDSIIDSVQKPLCEYATKIIHRNSRFNGTIAANNTNGKITTATRNGQYKIIDNMNTVSTYHTNVLDT